MRYILILFLLFTRAVAGSWTVSPGQAFDWGDTLPGRSAALPSLTNVVMGSANSSWTVWLRSTGSLLAYGINGYGQTNVVAGSNWAHVNAGWRHGIACDTDGHVREWGTPFGVPISTWEALRPAALSNEFVIKVAAGDNHSAALTTSGNVYSWGGDAAVTNSSGTFNDVIDLASGWYHLLMLHDNGTVTHVGDPSSPGQNFDTPPGVTNITDIWCSQWANYARKSDGTLFIWGMPDVYGEMTVPANVTNVIFAGGGRDHSAALKTNGTVVVWGDPTEAAVTSVPADLTNAQFLASGRYNPLAIQGSGGSGGGGGPSVVYVATTGNDTTGDGTLGNPYRTVQKGVDVSLDAGDQVIVLPGDYPEYVVTKASGTAVNPITIAGDGGGESSIRALRVNNHRYINVDGMTFWKGQGTGVSWNQSLRIESGAHSGRVQNCVFRDTPHLNRTNWVFNGAANTITSPSGSDWAAAGFENGGQIRLGASSIEPYMFVNQDTNLTITGIAGNTLTVNNLLTETNSSAWSIIYASGSVHFGWRGIEFIISGGAAATNWVIADNVFTNLYSTPVFFAGNGPTTFRQNRIYNSTAWAGFHPNTSNLQVTDNWFLDCEKFLFYSQREANDVPHPLGGGAYDFVQAYMHATVPGTNVVIARNWFENIHNPWGGIGELTTSTNWVIRSNVVVGVEEHLAIGINGTTANNNTLYRVGFDVGRTAGIIQTGNSASARATNMVNMRNVYVDIGAHVQTNAEGFYSNPYVTNSYFGSNYVAGPEPTAWQGKGSFTEIDGINGGDPLLVNPQNPRGADGIPFTDDDGLKPLPHSPIALKSLGALSPTQLSGTLPLAHFTVRPVVPGWYDEFGTNFNTAWESVPPFARTNFVRPWNTLDALGNVPCQVFIDASGSISGSFSTNSNYGINLYVFDWGDGATDYSWTATNTHTYLWPGEFTVTTRVRNTFNQWATNSLAYRVLPQDQYSGTIYHVATNGNDSTGTGTLAAPWLTISKAVAHLPLVAGDYIAVHPGEYNSYTDVNRNVATPSSRIAIHGFGAHIGGMQFRHPNWTIHGFDIDGNPSGTGVGVFVFQAADNMHVINCYLHDFNGNGGVYVTGSGVPTPTDGALNGRVIGCTFTNVADPNISFLFASNWVVANFRVFNTISEGDFIRPFGANHTIQDGYVFGLDSGGTGGHPDFCQLFNVTNIDTGIKSTNWMKDILFERVFHEGNTNSANLDGALGQLSSGFYADSRATNFIVRNCIFKNVRGAWSGSLDGTKFYNNLFYKSPRDGGVILTGGGDRGSSWGTRFYNNIFFGAGLNNAPNAGWYYQGAPYSDGAGSETNTTVYADYDYVAGISGTDKNQAPPNQSDYWGSTNSTGVAMESHGINGGLPLFANEVNGDFRLTTNSPLWLSGTNLSSLPGMEGFNTDYNGRTITNWSIGPFAYAADSSGTEPPPSDSTPPTPDPMTWASNPAAIDNDSITMTATTATDSESPPVAYYFDETSGNPGGSDSGWQSSPVYVDSGLNGSTQYTYRVKARDALANETAFSVSRSATTNADPPPVVGNTIINTGTLNIAP